MSADRRGVSSAAGAMSRVRGSVLARFASMGVLNTLVDFVVYITLVHFGVHAVAANLISTSAGLVVSFVGNSRWVFRGGERRRSELPRFLVIAGFGIWIIQPAILLAFEHVSAFFAHGVGVAIAKLVAIGVAAVWNYVLYSRWVFKRAHQPAASEGETVGS